MPSWAYLVVLMFAGMLAWPTLEAPVMRRVRRLRRKLTRKKAHRSSYSYGRSRAEPPAPAPSPEPPSTEHPSQAV